MPRRRMLDPSFTEDTEVAQLTRDERLFLVGCLRNADDEGRLIGNAAYLKAEVFMYDDDIDLKCMQKIRNAVLEKMNTWRLDNIWRLKLYQNSGIEYLHFPNWFRMEKPSHPTPSKLPVPPDMGNVSSATQEIPPRVSGEAQEEIPQSSGEPPEEIEKVSGAVPPQLSQGQSSLDKNSLVKSSGVQEDFRKFISSEKDLTDFLTTTLDKYLPRGPTWAVEVLQQLWVQILGKRMKGTPLALTLKAVNMYPAPVLAKAYVKAVRYGGGKYNSAKYLEKILKEKMDNS